MLAGRCDTAEGPAATHAWGAVTQPAGTHDTTPMRPRHGARLGVPVRMLGMLAGSAGPVWVLVNLAQF